jgi:hypothetical protein
MGRVEKKCPPHRERENFTHWLCQNAESPAVIEVCPDGIAASRHAALAAEDARLAMTSTVIARPKVAPIRFNQPG